MTCSVGCSSDWASFTAFAAANAYLFDAGKGAKAETAELSVCPTSSRDVGIYRHARREMRRRGGRKAYWNRRSRLLNYAPVGRDDGPLLEICEGAQSL